jgi:hypothetical protein
MTAKRSFTSEEARKIGNALGIDWAAVDLEQFRRGLEVELEHGAYDPQTNVTDDDVLMTGKIAWAHLKRFTTTTRASTSSRQTPSRNGVPVTTERPLCSADVAENSGRSPCGASRQEERTKPWLNLFLPSRLPASKRPAHGQGAAP